MAEYANNHFNSYIPDKDIKEQFKPSSRKISGKNPALGGPFIPFMEICNSTVWWEP